MILSVQLYSVRDAMAEEPAQTLAAISEKISHVELAGTYGVEPREFRSMLDNVGLSVSGSHVGLDALEGGLQDTLDNHRELGCDLLILPWIGEADYADGWEAFANRLDDIAKRLAEEGFAFAYHNHDFEFRNNGLRTLFASSSPLVRSELDLGWVHHAGENPAAMVRELRSRLACVHLKDTKGLANHEDVIAGEGVVDWQETLRACVEMGVPVGVIEMDNPPGDPLQDVLKCHAFYERVLPNLS